MLLLTSQSTGWTRRASRGCGEVQQSVDRAVIIHRGRLLAAGTLGELDPHQAGLESVFLD